MPMTGSIDRVEVITSVQRRRRWSAEEKARIVQETYAPGFSVSLLARQHGIAPNQVFTWRRLYAEGALSAVGAGEEGGPGVRIPGVAAPGVRIATAVGQEDPRERDPARRVGPGTAKKRLLCSPSCGVKPISDALGVARSNLVVQAAGATRQRRGRRPQPEAALLAEIKALIADLRLPAHPCPAPPTAARARRRGAQREAGLPGDEGEWSAARTAHRQR
jgi:transposase-like protein